MQVFKYYLGLWASFLCLLINFQAYLFVICLNIYIP